MTSNKVFRNHRYTVVDDSSVIMQFAYNCPSSYILMTVKNAIAGVCVYASG